MSVIAKRYAEALLDVALKHEEMEEIETEFAVIVKNFQEMPDFKNILINPEIKKELKKDFIFKTLNENVSVNLLNFINLLIDKNRVSILKAVFEDYVILADKKRDALTIKVYTALEINKEQMEEIKQKYIKIFNVKNAKIEEIIDPTFIGGVKIQIGDKVVDSTIKGRLEELKKILLK